MARDFDLFVIGAGSGGVRAARIAATHGARVGIAEGFRIGGTCVIRGCVPKKLLVYASELGHEFDLAQRYGWTTGPASHDWAVLRDNVAVEVTRLSGIYQRNMENAGVKVYAAHARFLDAHTVQLSSGETISADRILIATGAKPSVPDNFVGAELGFTSNEAFLLPALPKHVAIIGAGYIALEFAFIFRGLGCDVSLVFRGDKVLRGFDEDLRDFVHESLAHKGIHVVAGTPILGIATSGDNSSGRRVLLADGREITADAVMLATGRTPNTDGLDLAAAGLSTRADGAIEVDETAATAVPHIYAVGDVTNRVQLTPVAIREGHALADRLYGGMDRRVSYEAIPSAVFTQPALGVVGLTEAEARSRFGALRIFRAKFRGMKYAFAQDETRTLMKLVVRADTDQVVGCHLAGPDTPEMIQMVAIAVKAGLTKAQFDDTVALHPSAAEELVTMRTPVATS